MNDDSNESPKPAPAPAPAPFPSDAELEANIEAARQALFEAIAKYTTAYGRKQWSEGWDVGWLKGREALLSALRDELPQKSSPPSPIPAPSPQLTPPARNAKDEVLNLITERPGLRGVEIASALGANDSPMRFPERTVRTALHRLKHSKPPKIEIVDGRWYTSEVAATVPRQRQLIEDNDGPA